MRRAIAVGLGWMLALGLSGTASAQSDPVIGYWSGVSFAPEGTTRFAMTLNLDETFVSVLSLPNGTTQRVWGKYRGTQTGPTGMTIAFTTQGWLPYQTCVKGIGRIPRCTPYKPVFASPIALKFPSPVSARVAAMSFKVDQATWIREVSSPALLSKVIPDHQMLASPTTPSVFGQPTPRKYAIPP